MKLLNNLSIKKKGHLASLMAISILFTFAFYLNYQVGLFHQQTLELEGCTKTSVTLKEIAENSEKTTFLLQTLEKIDQKGSLKSIIPAIEFTLKIQEFQYKKTDSVQGYSGEMNRILTDYKNDLQKTIVITEEITSSLKAGSIEKAYSLFRNQYLPAETKFKESSEQISTIINKKTAIHFNNIAQKRTEIYFTLISSILILTPLMVFFINSLFSSTINHLKSISEALEDLTHGKLTIIKIKAGNDINYMAEKLNQHVETLQRTSEYAVELGKGNFNLSFIPSGKYDELGHSLLQMRNNLVKISEEEKERRWIGEGISELNEIIRRSENQETNLNDKIVAFLAKYFNSNQVALFLLSEDSGNAKILELKASYAYNRKKFSEKTILPGEGLAGQCFLENDIINITDIPRDYVHITSGLGEATPGNILISPVSDNDTVYGVIELATFRKISSSDIAFVKEASRIIASVTRHTRKPVESVNYKQIHEKLIEEIKSQEIKIETLTKESSLKQKDVFKREQILLNEIKQLKNKLAGIKGTDKY